MLKFHLDKLLFDRNMNQSDLYRKTKIRMNTINMYYNNYIQRMNVVDINKICEVLGCNVCELVEHIPDKKKEPKGS